MNMNVLLYFRFGRVTVTSFLNPSPTNTFITSTNLKLEISKERTTISFKLNLKYILNTVKLGYNNHGYNESKSIIRISGNTGPSK